jgi:hypothetical protein
MKEIDFIPEWYKSSRRRQISYRTQYVGLGCMLVVMTVWSLVTAHSISRARTELAQQAARHSEMQPVLQEFAETELQVAELRKKARLIAEMDSRIDVAGVLAEMSFLIDRTIVLSKVELTAEAFMNEQKDKSKSSSAVRLASGKTTGKETAPLGTVRFKVVINGVASDAGNVTELVSRFEGSPYFHEVTFSVGGNAATPASGAAGSDVETTEFKIGCYLANYRQEEPSLVSKMHTGTSQRRWPAKLSPIDNL